jgi:putative peptidoglycan lipid II flippase
LCLVRQELVTVLFQHGRFDAGDTTRVGRVVWAYGLGIWAYIAQQVLVRAYYAQRDAKTPMKIATAMVAVNLALNLLLVHWLQEAGVALGTALCAVLQLMILIRLYPARVGSLDLDALRRGMLRSAAACAAMLAVILLTRKAMQLAHVGTALLLVAEVAAGTAVYVAAAWLGRFPEVEEVRAAWRHRPAAAVS